MAGNIEYEVPTWNQIYEMLLYQAQKILAQNYRPDIVVGIARGGIIPARILADLLETSEFATIQIEFYVDINQTKAEPTLKQPLNTNVLGKKVLLVDDIADSGESLKLAKTHLQKIGASEVKTATSIKNPNPSQPPTSTKNIQPIGLSSRGTQKKHCEKSSKNLRVNASLNQEVAKLVKAGSAKTAMENF